MYINIFGSTGIIGSKTIDIISNYFPQLKIDLLLASNNANKLIKQANKINPKSICLKNTKKINYYKNRINPNIKIIDYKDLSNYLKNNKTKASILSISGNSALEYLEDILINTKQLGLVNKECIVSCGHLFKKLLKKHKVKIFPLDSEHFSIYNLDNRRNMYLKNFYKIYLTASGGPLLNYNKKRISNVDFNEVIKHPKWKMGYKNSIDSSTLANKCLELIEAMYLFQVPMKDLDIVIHPEALIHSIIEYNNSTSIFNYFYNDMSIPILNFMQYITNKKLIEMDKFKFNKNLNLNFIDVDKNKFPIYDIFKNIDYKLPQEIIKFNVANQYAVELFKKNKIKYIQMPKIIEKSISYELKASINSIGSIIKYENEFNKIMISNNEKV
ncbi:hypothetical protein OAJ30_04510 [Alphaproteobacteria bacterium]|nr:hypothetical protein [Alphaproteobacteria bacterium]